MRTYLLFDTEITNRFQTARSEVRHLLLQYLLPWLHNMELVDPNVPPVNSNSSYYQVMQTEYSADVCQNRACRGRVDPLLCRPFFRGTYRI